MELHNLFVSWAMIIGGVIGLFTLAEQVTQDSVKKNISLWLRNRDTLVSEVNWADEFGRMFDAIFGEKHLSIRCFFVSSVASIISVVIVSILLFNMMSNDIKEEIIEGFIINEPLFYPLIGYILVVGVYNLLPDYLSLLESRMVISIIKTSDKASIVVVAIIFDALVTLSIWVIGFLFLPPLLKYLLSDTGSWWSTIEFFWEGLLELSSIDTGGDYILLTLIGSTYFTSIWIWLYLIGGGFIKLYYSFTKTTKLFFSFLDLEKRPLLSLGFVSCILITILFLVSAPFAVSAPVST